MEIQLSQRDKALEDAIAKLMLRGGLGYDEARTLLREVLATVPSEAALKLDREDTED